MRLNKQRTSEKKRGRENSGSVRTGMKTTGLLLEGDSEKEPINRLDAEVVKRDNPNDGRPGNAARTQENFNASQSGKGPALPHKKREKGTIRICVSKCRITVSSSKTFRGGVKRGDVLRRRCTGSAPRAKGG